MFPLPRNSLGWEWGCLWWDGQRFLFLLVLLFLQTIMNKLWLGFDLTEAIAAPILHVNSKGHVEYEPKFNQVRLRTHLPPETHATQRLL